MPRQKHIKCRHCGNAIQYVRYEQAWQRVEYGQTTIDIRPVLREDGDIVLTDDDRYDEEGEKVLIDSPRHYSIELEAEGELEVDVSETDVWVPDEDIGYFRCTQCRVVKQNLYDLIEVQDDLEALLGQVLDIARGQ